MLRKFVLCRDCRPFHPFKEKKLEFITIGQWELIRAEGARIRPTYGLDDQVISDRKSLLRQLIVLSRKTVFAGYAPGRLNHGVLVLNAVQFGNDNFIGGVGKPITLGAGLV